MGNFPTYILALSLVSLITLPSVKALTTGQGPTQTGTSKYTEGFGRREWIQQGLVSAGIAVVVSDCHPARAESLSSPEREALLHAIYSRSDDETILKCIDNLIASKSGKSSASSTLTDRIDGKWKLVWSIKDDKFSPLLQLPGPLKPTSYQFAGLAAAPIVGEGRIAQMLTNGVLGPTKTWLSSGVVEYENDSSSSTLQIRPPFRLEFETPFTPNRQVLVEAGSDSDFRAANARSFEAQSAPPNLYQQLYLEGIDKGSVRISKIIEGDPVIVGATFVHVKE